jgi:hypothetical protein
MDADQSGDGDTPKSRQTLSPETVGTSKIEDLAKERHQGDGPRPNNQLNSAALSHLWRGVRHTKLTDWLIIMLTAVIAYSTWSSDKTFEHQLQEMRATSAQTDRAIETSITNGATVAYQAALTDRALRLAERNAETTKDQLATARDTENRQLRAYLHVVTRAPLHLAVGEVPQWGIEYSVLGQTPAYDAQVRQLVMLAPYPLPVDITRFYRATGFQPVNKVAIFPGEHPWAMDSLTCVSPTGKKIIDCRLSQDAMTALAKDPKIRLYVFGMVNYRDAFGALRHTPYCFSRDPVDGTSQICPHLKAPD